MAIYTHVAERTESRVFNFDCTRNLLRFRASVMYPTVPIDNFHDLHNLRGRTSITFYYRLESRLSKRNMVCDNGVSFLIQSYLTNVADKASF